MNRIPASQTISTFCDDVLGALDGVALAQRIANKEIHPLEAAEAAIARAKKADPALHAIVTETFERARQQADGNVHGPFAGVPSFIKDIDEVQGVPTSYGSRATSAKPATKSDHFVALYESMGFVSLGKSALAEFGLTGTTEPMLHEPTRNPWNLAHSSGGSSGGAAALVAAGVVPIAHANDGGGSIRIPAACCGLVGLKPSRDRLGPIAKAKLLPIKITTQGIVSRSVRDTAAFYAWAEKLYRNPKLPEIGLVEGPGKSRLRIGLFTGLENEVICETDVVQTINDTGKLCEALGHRVDEIPCPFKKEVIEDFLIYWGMLAFVIKNVIALPPTGFPLDKTKLEPFTHSLSDYFKSNALKFPLVVWRLKRFFHEYQRVFSRYDVLLTPVTGHSAPEIGYLSPNLHLDVKYERLKQFAPFTCLQNISGAPGIALPMGFSRQNGLPIGAHFAAPFGQERRLLDLAFELEEAKPWPLLG